MAEAWPEASAVAASPKKKANQRSGDAPAYLCVAKVCTDAMIYMDDKGVCLFPNINIINQSVFCVTLSHPDAYPQIDFKLLEKMDAMLKAKADDDDDRPRDWEDLVQKLHIVPVNTGTFVPYNLPYKNWQRAFYVAGEPAACQNFVMELDNCIVYTVQHADKPKHGKFPLHVQLTKNVGFKLTEEDFEYDNVVVEAGLSATEHAVTPLQVYPPQGVRPLVVHFEVVTEKEVAMTIFGDTYRHRRALDTAQLEMTKEEPDPNNQQLNGRRLETFYLMTTKDVSDETEAAFIKRLLTDDIENAIVDLRLISKPAQDSAAYKFIEDLKASPNLFISLN